MFWAGFAVGFVVGLALVAVATAALAHHFGDDGSRF